MSRDTCRYPGCDEPPRGYDHPDDPDAFQAKFCSDGHAIKFDHLRAEAREARRAEEGR